MYKDSFFWFSQPSTFLNSLDIFLIWFFVGMMALAIVLRLVNYLKFHPVNKGLVRRFSRAFFSMGLVGVVWFGFRYENTPTLADRFWAAAITLILLIWLAFILKYIIRDFGADKKIYEREQVNSKYIPGKK